MRASGGQVGQHSDLQDRKKEDVEAHGGAQRQKARDVGTGEAWSTSVIHRGIKPFAWVITICSSKQTAPGFQTPSPQMSVRCQRRGK